MENALKISCGIDTTDTSADLNMEIWVDNECVRNFRVCATEFQYLVPDDSGDHSIKFVLKNKQSDHTQLDATGAIVKDACAVIKNFKFDDIEMDSLLQKLAVYEHDFNGTGSATQQQFFGSMGCNGTVELKFSTPSYLWILSHM